MNRARRARVMGAWAGNAAALNAALRTLDPSRRSERHEVAGGWLVLDGAGMYVNRAIAAGIRPVLSAADAETIVERSRVVGVTPAAEVSSLTAAESVDVLRANGFAADASPRTVFIWPSGCALPDAPASIRVLSVSSATLPKWQEAAARGWGYDTPQARLVSDLFARAVFEIDGDGMLIAVDADDGRTLGSASLTRRDGVATLGGMSTIPSERRRGVQRALVRHRIELAIRSGHDLVTASATAGGASERNLTAFGFEAVDTIWTYSVS